MSTQLTSKWRRWIYLKEFKWNKTSFCFFHMFKVCLNKELICFQRPWTSLDTQKTFRNIYKIDIKRITAMFHTMQNEWMNYPQNIDVDWEGLSVGAGLWLDFRCDHSLHGAFILSENIYWAPYPVMNMPPGTGNASVEEQRLQIKVSFQ